MTNKELRSYRGQLQALASRLTAQVWNMRDETLRTSGNADGVSLPMDQTDWDSHETDEERTLCVLENEEQLLREVQFAQKRIDRGVFGLCEECGSAIAKERLDALPYARHCIACAVVVEKEVASI